MQDSEEEEDNQEFSEVGSSHRPQSERADRMDRAEESFNYMDLINNALKEYDDIELSEIEMM